MHQLPTRLVAYHGLVEPCVVACMQWWRGCWPAGWPLLADVCIASSQIKFACSFWREALLKLNSTALFGGKPGSVRKYGRTEGVTTRECVIGKGERIERRPSLGHVPVVDTLTLMWQSSQRYLVTSYP